MDTKSLLYGLIGFFAGGLLVSSAASFEATPKTHSSSTASSLENARGAEYDKLFIEHMITHHQDAVDMAKLSQSRTERKEILDMSKNIISVQEQEIATMRQWQKSWQREATQPTNHHQMVE